MGSRISRSLEAETGYLFCLPYLKMLLFAVSLYPVPGSEASQWISGQSWAMQETPQWYANAGWGAGVPFLYHQPALGRAHAIEMRICTWDVWIDQLADRGALVWDAVWAHGTWGHTTAVVYYTAAEMAHSEDLLF
jgi:hypothetical protein